MKSLCLTKGLVEKTRIVYSPLAPHNSSTSVIFNCFPSIKLSNNVFLDLVQVGFSLFQNMWKTLLAMVKTKFFRFFACLWAIIWVHLIVASKVQGICLKWTWWQYCFIPLVAHLQLIALIVIGLKSLSCANSLHTIIVPTI